MYVLKVDHDYIVLHSIGKVQENNEKTHIPLEHSGWVIYQPPRLERVLVGFMPLSTTYRIS